MSQPYVVDRALHWLSALAILFMLLNMRAQMHTVDYQVKGQIEHRVDAIEIHASAGVILLVLLLCRFVWFHLNKDQIPRQLVTKTNHQRFIKVTHFLLYLAVAALAVTGFLMANNSDLILSIFGVQLSTGGEQHGQFYGKVRDIHLWLINAFWWLIGIHVIGAMAARK